MQLRILTPLLDWKREPTLHSSGHRPPRVPRERCHLLRGKRAIPTVTKRPPVPLRFASPSHPPGCFHTRGSSLRARAIANALRSPRVSSDYWPPTSSHNHQVRPSPWSEELRSVQSGMPHHLSPRLHVAGHHLGAKHRPVWCPPQPVRHLALANRQRQPEVCGCRLPLELGRPLPCRCAPLCSPSAKHPRLRTSSPMVATRIKWTAQIDNCAQKGGEHGEDVEATTTRKR